MNPTPPNYLEVAASRFESSYSMVQQDLPELVQVDPRGLKVKLALKVIPVLKVLQEWMLFPMSK